MIILRFWRSACCALAIFIACSLPSSTVKSVAVVKIPHFDKAVHFGMFMVFALVLIWDLRVFKKKDEPLKCLYTIAALGAFLFGIAIEAAQHFFFPTRGAEILDVVANGAGIMVGLTLFYFFIENSKVLN